MKRCKQCDAPLLINGTHCNRCNAARDDLEEQEHLLQKRGIVVTFLLWVLGTFFSLSLLFWLGVCAAIGGAVGYLAWLVGVHHVLCWVIGIVVTVFTYGLSWLFVIYGD